MCNFCNGTHVIKDVNGPLAYFLTCPVCGPKTAEELEKQSMENRRRLEKARAEFGIGVDSA